MRDFVWVQQISIMLIGPLISIIIMLIQLIPTFLDKFHFKFYSLVV